MACYQSCGNSNRGSFTKLKTGDALADVYLDKLRDFAKQVKPVFRYNCPTGYNHDAKEVPDTLTALAPNNLWFMDHHGHVCKPDAGWGTQPALNMYDQVAQKYRNEAKGLTASQVSDAAAQMLCSPCARSGLSKRSVSRGSDMLISTISDIQGTDSKIDEMGLGGGEYDISMISSLSGGAVDDMSVLSGGAKLSEKVKCQVNSMVGGLTEEEQDNARAAALDVIKTFNDKEVKAASDQLECILSKDKYSSIRNDILGEYTDKETGRNLQATPAMFAQEAAICADASIHPSLLSALGIDNDDLMSCVSSGSCTSGKMSLKHLRELSQVEKQLVIEEDMYDTLMKIYSKCRSKARSCGGWCEEDELKYKRKIESAYRKAMRKMNVAMDSDELKKEIDKDWEQMKACAQLCGSNVDCGQTEGCVRSDVCGSNVCVPKFLADLKKSIKTQKKKKQANDDLSVWFSDFYADRRKMQI